PLIPSHRSSDRRHDRADAAPRRPRQRRGAACLDRRPDPRGPHESLHPVARRREDNRRRGAQARTRLDRRVRAPPRGGGDGLAVGGGDEEGTVNAAVELAARLPRVWGMNGITLPAVEEQSLRHVRAHGVQAREAAVTSILIDSDKRGVARIALRITVPDADGPRAAKVFEEL